jgi:hypothetical protein
MGSFALAEWRMVKIAAAGIIAGFIPIYLMRWRLNVMSMGEAEAKNLGVNVRRERIIFIAASTLMVSIAVSVSGINRLGGAYGTASYKNGCRSGSQAACSALYGRGRGIHDCFSNNRTKRH